MDDNIHKSEALKQEGMTNEQKLLFSVRTLISKYNKMNHNAKFEINNI